LTVQNGAAIMETLAELRLVIQLHISVEEGGTMANQLKRLLSALGCWAAILALGAVPVAAQTLVDPPLFIGNPATCPNSTGCSYVYNNETIGLGPSSLDIYDQGKSGSSTVGTIVLLIGVPNQTSSFTAPQISSFSIGGSASKSAGATAQLGGTNVYMGSWNTSTGYATQFSASSTQPVTSAVGLQDQGDASESFTNWQQWDANAPGIGITVNPTTGSFAIFAYTINGVTLNQTGYVTLNFSGALPLGTFAVGYGCDASTTGACNPNGNVMSTPFTQAGLVDATPVPEPGTMALWGVAALVLLGGGLRRAWA
jgi:hypothetical protein